MKKKKVNPKRRPATQMDVKRAKMETTDKAIVLTKVIMLTALLDAELIKPEHVKFAWERTQAMAENVLKGYCTIQDMYNVLVNDYGIEDLS
jgi:hypothetical protein